MDINGASAIVTGGASGIGAASARMLAERGAKVVIADLQEDKGNALADEIGGAFCRVDVTDTDVVVDVAGWLDADGGFVPAIPQRLVDTRFALGPIPT